ncbi:MAG TPA: monofunctional biosynthetic peptidoglycan transglycosylase [Arenimonas sp.]|nr:monofunctional biosynthetic peptidoglycan transglycosylase [Arenimonas sp.]
MSKSKSKKKWLRKLIIWLPLSFCIITISQVLILKWLDPFTTSFMMTRQASAILHADWSFQIDYRWRDLNDISKHLPLAAVASEDQRFPEHHGFDFTSIEKAYKSNLKGRKVRGGSTISQQLAKNLFLWSGRSYVRKALEAWYTFWIEMLWSKKRILEMYVNVVEFGNGVYGAEAASRRFFNMPAKSLSKTQSARLAAVLPNPKLYNAANPGPYVRRRTSTIERQMRALGGSSYLKDCCSK